MTTEEIKALVIQRANSCGIDSNIALAQMQRESGWRQDVIFGPYVGGAGERGIAQFTPDTWTDFGSGPHTNAYDINMSLDAWCNYMSYLLRTFDGDMRYALMGYNGGPGNVVKGKVSQAAQNYATEIMAAAGQTGADLAIVVTPNNAGEPDQGLSPWLIIGAIVLLLFVAKD